MTLFKCYHLAQGELNYFYMVLLYKQCTIILASPVNYCNIISDVVQFYPGFKTLLKPHRKVFVTNFHCSLPVRNHMAGCHSRTVQAC